MTTYAVARDKIKSGDLLAWDHKGWRTFYDLQIQAVKFFTQSEYCHVGLAWVCGGRVFIIESVGAGIRIVPLSMDLPCYWLSMGVDWSAGCDEYILSKIKQPYSRLLAVMGFLGLKAAPRQERKWTCAEFVLDFYRTIIGFPWGECKPTPSCIVEMALEEDSTLVLLEAEYTDD